jgi:FkbM family methyltransferase
VSLLKTLSFLASHPLTRDKPLAAWGRFARWQVESRLKDEVQFDWIDGAKLAVRNGMTGATGNIYCGLHEFADMAFVMHLLQPGDLFVDVGANIGSYTILASVVCKAETIAVEPDPGAATSLRRNLELNGVSDQVQIVEAAIGAETGTARFTIGLDTTNRIASDRDGPTREVQVQRLDDLLRERRPVLIKLDVEGFEPEVVAGAAATLRRSSLLAVETESRDQRIIQQLNAAGFEELFYEPLSRTLCDEPVGRQSNALFVRDRAACVARLKTAPRRRILSHAI